MKKLVAISLAIVSLLAVSQVAFAGEWSPGNGGTAAKGKGNSACLFNGADQPDETVVVVSDDDGVLIGYEGQGDGEEVGFDFNENGYYDAEPYEVGGVTIVEYFGGDDADWGATKAGGRVQSGGQIVSSDPKNSNMSFAGIACNPNSSFEE